MATNGDLNNLRDSGTTESDATHIRFRERHPQESIKCLSCDQNFFASSDLEIVEHYSENYHLNYYADCLYCKGKVHRYNTIDKTELYHSCFRWRRGLDK